MCSNHVKEVPKCEEETEAVVAATAEKRGTVVLSGDELKIQEETEKMYQRDMEFNG